MNIKNFASTIVIASALLTAPCYSEGNNAFDLSVKSTSTLSMKREKGSGMATGRRTHKPMSVAKPIDKASPMLSGRLSYRIKRQLLCPVRVNYLVRLSVDE